MMIVFIILTISSIGLVFIFKKIYVKESEDKQLPGDIELTKNPVELAYLKHGLRVSFGVLLFSLVYYKYAKRTSNGLMRFISVQEKENDAAPYSNKIIKIVSAKMRSAMIVNMANNKSLQKRVEGMLSEFSERMVTNGLMHNEEVTDNMRFGKFITFFAAGVFTFYALLLATGFWMFIVSIVVGLGVMLVIKKLYKNPLHNSLGKKYLKRCFDAIGKANYSKGIYSYAYEGESRFVERDIREFLGVKEVDWDD